MFLSLNLDSRQNVDFMRLMAEQKFMEQLYANSGSDCQGVSWCSERDDFEEEAPRISSAD